jgi:hypothetical protein
MTINQAISAARAELGLSPAMEATDRKLSLTTAGRVMADFYREFEPMSQQFNVVVENREAVIPKNIEITKLYHGGIDISAHRVRAEDIPA